MIGIKNGAVLQRDENGKCKTLINVKAESLVTTLGKTEKCGGLWLLTEIPVGGPYSFSICADTVKYDFKDVYVGERYFDYLEEFLEVKAFGYGKNGAQYLHLIDQARQLWDDRKEDVDYIIVFAGTNDFYRNIPIGEWFNEKETEVIIDEENQIISKRKVREFIFNENTFKGRINILFSFLKEKYATKEIIAITPLHRAFATFGRQNIQYDELFQRCRYIF